MVEKTQLPDQPAPETLMSGGQIGVVGNHAHIEGGIHFYAPSLGKPAPPFQLPPRVPHFTNRTAELTQLFDNLHPGQVFTLCGPGGIGKTALAIEVIWRYRDEIIARFPDGILFHSFYNQPQAAFALENIARSFGEEPRPTPRDAAARALSGKHALLILDGAEDADDLRAVLDITADCSVLITSRARKDTISTRQDVRPLEPPEALTLLRRWGGDQAGDTEVASEICRLVGGLPLAVRLVGRYLSETGETAGEYLTWLRTTPLDALDHGQIRLESVSVLLEKSLAQLSPTAVQILGVVGLLALAPFGRDTVAAALACPVEMLRKPLGELVNYGLLLPRGTSYEVTHVLIHTYAHEQMQIATETLRRLAVYYISLTDEQQILGLSGYHRLASERLHLLRVLNACADRAEWKTVNALAGVLAGPKRFLELQGYWSDLLSVVETGLAAAQTLCNRGTEGAYLGYLGFVYSQLGQVDKAITSFEQALIIAREVGNRRSEGGCLGNLGRAYYTLGQMDRAIAFYEEALTIAYEVGDRQNEGIWLGHLGFVYHTLGQVDKSIISYEQALSIAREIGDRQTEGAWLGNLGNAHRVLGQVDKAIEFYEEALNIAYEVGDRQNQGVWSGHLGFAYSHLGQVEKALKSYEQALTIDREIGNHQNEGAWLGNLGSAYRVSGQVDKAIAFYEEALGIAHKVGDRRNEGAWLGHLGFVYRALGQVDKAIMSYEKALTIAREIGDRQNEGAWLGNLGSAYRTLGQVDESTAFYEEALIIANEVGDRQNEGIWLGHLGNIYHTLAQTDKARVYLQQALAIFEEIRSPYANYARELLAALDLNSPL